MFGIITIAIEMADLGGKSPEAQYQQIQAKSHFLAVLPVF
jgi:hypothetical protein